MVCGATATATATATAVPAPCFIVFKTARHCCPPKTWGSPVDERIHVPHPRSAGRREHGWWGERVALHAHGAADVQSRRRWCWGCCSRGAALAGDGSAPIPRLRRVQEDLEQDGRPRAEAVPYIWTVSLDVNRGDEKRINARVQERGGQPRWSAYLASLRGRS